MPSVRAIAFAAIAAGYIDAAVVPRAACQVTLYQKTVHSETKPRGPIEAIVITGAQAGNTKGGKATAKERCAYLFEPDVAKGSSTPRYKGREWPYYKVGEGCEVVLDSSIPDGAKLREPGFVSFDKDTRILLVGGLPLYQYDGDSEGECLCNEPGVWTSIDANGVGASYEVTFPNQ